MNNATYDYQIQKKKILDVDILHAKRFWNIDAFEIGGGIFERKCLT